MEAVEKNNELINSENEVIKSTITNENKPETTEYKPKGLAAILNKFFKFAERGGTMKGEICAGISVFLVSICVLLMNTRIIGEAVGADNAGYCGIYMAAAIVSFIGSLAIGLVARLPLIQTTSLGLTTTFISLMGAGNGLTYQNLLAISFIGSIIYALLVSLPVVKNFVQKALPEPIRKALPVGMGLYIVFFALKDCGIVSVNASGVFTLMSISDLTNKMAVMGAVAAVVAAIACFALYRLKKYVSAPVLYGLIIGIIVFYVGGLIVGFSLIFSVNRAYIAVGAENMFTIAAGFNGLEFGSVFTKGFDFSAYKGNVGQLFVYAMLAVCFMSMYETDANTHAVALYNDTMSLDEKSMGKVFMVNSATNVIAPIFGSMPVTVAKQSSIAAHDGGKSGLTSVVASIGYLVAMFTWIFFALLASYTAVVSDYGHATSNSYAEYAQATFAVIDGIMIFVGIMMMKGISGIDYKDMSELIPFIGTIAIFVCTQNIVYGVAAGLILFVIAKLLTFDVKEIKSIGIPTSVLTVIMILILALI